MTTRLTQDVYGIWRDQESVEISYPDTGNDYCFGIEDHSFWFKHRNDVILTMLKRIPFKGNFADIGGGNGFQLQFLQNAFPSRKFYLIEPGYEGCRNAKKRGVLNVYNLTFQKFPFHEMEIGAVGLFDVLEHIEDDSGFLKELAYRVGKGKYIFISVPAYRWLWSITDVHGGHFRRYVLRDFQRLAGVCKLKLTYAGYFFAYIPLAAFFIRALPYRLGLRRKWKANATSKDHLSGLWGSRFINMINKEELQRLKTGRLSFGASCIVVYET